VPWKYFLDHCEVRVCHAQLKCTDRLTTDARKHAANVVMQVCVVVAFYVTWWLFVSIPGDVMWCGSWMLEVANYTDRFTNHPWLGIELWSCPSVCNMITCESLDVGSSYLHICYISRQYRSSSYLKVIMSRSESTTAYST